MNLGYPIEGPFPCWVIDVQLGIDEAGLPKTAPIAFSPDQACEIARRIVSHYKLTDEDLA